MLDLATIDKKYLSARTGKDGHGLLTPICRMNFPVFFTPRLGKKAKPDDKKKYSVSIFIPDTCDISLLKKVAADAAMAEWGSKAKDMAIKSPFLKAADFKYEGLLPSWTLMRLTSTIKPDVLEAYKGSLVKLTEEDPEKVYSGRWATLDVTAKPYDSGNKGVTFYLNHVMLLNHDDNLSGRMKAEDLFEAPEGDFSGPAESGGSSTDSLF